MSTTIIHQGRAYELSVNIESTKYGHHLRVLRYVPIAQRPERQARFQTVLTTAELETLHQAIGKALKGATASSSNQA
jgi:hypothetical protein